MPDLHLVDEGHLTHIGMGPALQNCGVVLRVHQPVGQQIPHPFRILHHLFHRIHQLVRR